MSSPKKRPYVQPTTQDDGLQAKRMRMQPPRSVGTSLSDSSDDDRPSFGRAGFGQLPQGFVSAPVVQSRNDQLDTTSSQSEQSADEINHSGFGHGASDGSEKLKSDLSSPHQLRKAATPQEIQYSDTAAKLMAKMGYKSGTGLGRSGQGRVNIVEASMQKGRRGLGHSVQGFEQVDVAWDFEREEVRIEEHVTWIPTCAEPIPALSDMMPWIVEGKKKLILDDESEFVSAKTLTDVLNCKSIFDNLEDEEMRRARTRSNPYETIRGVFFLNRAAMKMANMDAVTGFMFTNPRDDKGHPLIKSNELLYFADICAGPGGFSEYVLWRKKWEAKGYGFTLKGPCDFKLEDFYAASSELFEPHYGVGVLDGDGDIYRPDNQAVFRQFVWDNTDGAGLHFVMGDGGFSVEGEENIQEILSKRLYLCQFLVGLSVTREGGSFVCKLFDIFTPFSVGLIYLMYRAYTRVSIFKPVTSRPANSERYIICQGLRAGSDVIHDYMSEINKRMESTFSRTLSDRDIVHIVPLDVMKGDRDFYDYIYESNESLGKIQAQALVKIQTFAQNVQLRERRQAEVREKLLELWQIPERLRTAPDKSEQPMSKFKKMTEGIDIDISSQKELCKETLSHIHSPYDYKCVLTGADEQWFLLSLGKSQVYKWDGRPGKGWRKVDDVKMELPRNTLVEAEFVQELRGEARGQRKVIAVHIIDALVLGDECVMALHHKERHQKLQKFVKAIHRPTRPDLAPIRVKEIHRLEELHKVFDRLEMKMVKGAGGRYRVCYNCPSDLHHEISPQQHGSWLFEPSADQLKYFVPTGIFFIKTVKDPWMLAFSKSQKRWYWYNTLTRESVFNYPKDSISEYSHCLKNRIYWKWSERVRIMDQQENFDSSLLSRDDVLHIIHKKLS